MYVDVFLLPRDPTLETQTWSCGGLVGIPDMVDMGMLIVPPTHLQVGLALSP